MVSPVLSIQNLSVSIGEPGREVKVLDGVDLAVVPGKLHVIMGPNGSGKSSLAYTLMGHPRYQIVDGQILCDGASINDLLPHERARLGLFLALQHPYEIDGVPYKDFLRQAYNALYDGTPQQLRIRDFHEMLLARLDELKMDRAIIDRSVNVGFSGGEKKRAEMLQLAVLRPRIAILDEIDSGLDVDALKLVCQTLLKVREANPSMTIVIITHYQRIFDHLVPDSVHIMRHGKIVKTGGRELVHEIDRVGFALTSAS